MSLENKALLDIFLRWEMETSKGKDGKPNRKEKAYLTYAYATAITWLGGMKRQSAF